MNAFITRLGKAVGNVVGVLYQAGRDAIDMVIKNVLPFIAFIAARCFSQKATVRSRSSRVFSAPIRRGTESPSVSSQRASASRSE